jgi:hypothetical protein
MSSSSGPRRGVKRGLDDPEQSQSHSARSNRGEVTIRFRSSDKQRDFVCSPEEQDVLRRRSEYFAELLANNDEDTIEIAEEDCINAVSFLVTLLKDKAPTAHSLGWDESWVGLSVKWLAREYSEVFADMADRHIRAVVGKLEERKALRKQAARGCVFFAVPAGTDMGEAKGFENKVYDATAEKNVHGVVIYQMRDDPDKVIEYWEPLKRWAWKTREALGINTGRIVEVRPGQGASPDLTTVTEVAVTTGKPAPENWSAPIKICPLTPTVLPVEMVTVLPEDASPTRRSPLMVQEEFPTMLALLERLVLPTPLLAPTHAVVVETFPPLAMLSELPMLAEPPMII